MERFCRILVPSSRFRVFGRHKALLLCKSPCEGGCVGDGKTPLTTAPPSEEKFPEEICSSPVQDEKIAARQEDRCKQIKIHRSHKTERECSRNRKHSLILSALLIENSRDFKRAAALLLSCARRAAKKATSSRRLDTALLFADKKREVEKNGRPLVPSQQASVFMAGSRGGCMSSLDCRCRGKHLLQLRPLPKKLQIQTKNPYSRYLQPHGYSSPSGEEIHVRPRLRRGPGTALGRSD